MGVENMARLPLARTRLIHIATACLAMTAGLSHAGAAALATTNRALNDGFGPDAGRWHGSAAPGIDTLSVGLDAGDGRGGVSAPSSLATGAASAKAPTSGGDSGTSMAWFFNGTELHVGDTSNLLIFSSPFLPEFDFLQLNSGLAGPVVSPLVASPSDRPVPEPVAGALTLIACGALLRRARRNG
jgi:hypothetical protein